VSRYRQWWAVTTEQYGRPLYVEGPYRSRAIAREVLAAVRQEDAEEQDGSCTFGPCTHRIVQIFNTVAPSEFTTWMAARERAS
jgi:hypothetical protein